MANWPIIETKKIPVKNVHTGDNVRKEDVEADHIWLVDSIKEIGQLQPIRVYIFEEKDGEPQYSVILGQRRVLAMKQLAASDSKFKEIRADIVEVPIGISKDELEAALIVQSLLPVNFWSCGNKEN